jgi:hypothetical protein
MSVHPRWHARPRVGHIFPEELALLGDSCREFDRVAVADVYAPPSDPTPAVSMPGSSTTAAQPKHTSALSEAGAQPARFHPAWDEEPPPFVDLMLAIHPLRHQQVFWSSATWKQSTRNIDVWYVGFVIINNTMLVLYSGKLPPVALPGLVQFSWLYMALGLVQSLCAASQTPFYYHTRHFLVLLNRCA